MKGYCTATDQEILDDYFKRHKFILQIVRERKAGIKRVRQVIRNKSAGIRTGTA